MTLPNFILAGVPKSGTTSLYYYLQQHPDIYLSSLKEPRYFLNDSEGTYSQDPKDKSIVIRTMEDYVALFDDVKDEKAIGEASVYYMYSPVALERIQETLPEVKLLFSLRNPIDRAYSAYWYNVTKGNTTLPVEEVLNETGFYVRLGCYYSYLIKWYEAFDPSQIKVVLVDDMKKDSLAVVRDICRFLDVDEDFTLDLTMRNQGGVPQNFALAGIYRKFSTSQLRKTIQPWVPASFRTAFRDLRTNNLEKAPPIPKEIVQRLGAFYHDDIVQLETLLARDLSAWKV